MERVKFDSVDNAFQPLKKSSMIFQDKLNQNILLDVYLQIKLEACYR